MNRFSVKTILQTTRVVVIGLTTTLTMLSWGPLLAADSTEAMLKEVLSIEADPDYGEYLASECMTCHNAKDTDSKIPIIHGKESAYLAEALLQYKNKTRENETMRSVAGVLGVDEIAALVAYFSQQ